MSNPVPGAVTLTSIADDSDIDAGPHRSNYSAIQTFLNAISTALRGGSSGQVLTATDSTDVAWMDASALAVPSGAMLEFGGASAPSGWLLCDGSAVSRATYSALFGAISTTYGAGDGSTTFNVPDFRGRVPVGYAASGGHTDVATLGNNEGSSASARRPKHPHTNGLSVSAGSLSAALTADVRSNAGGTGPEMTAGNTGSSDSGTQSLGSIAISGSPSLSGTIGAAGTANDAPAYLVVNKIIKT